MPPFDFSRSATHDALDTHPCGACPVRSLTVCGALDTEELSRMAEIAVTQRIDAHQTIFTEGEAANAMYNVTSGTVKIYKLLADGRRQITGFLASGDFIGLAVGDIYTYSAETVSDTTVCRFGQKQLSQLTLEFPRLRERLFSMTQNELAAAQDQMLLLGRKTAREKIASFLLKHSKRAVERGFSGNPIHLAMGRADIADYLGLTTETVSRTFTQFKSTGVIRLLEGGRVEITDRDGLEDIAEGL